MTVSELFRMRSAHQRVVIEVVVAEGAGVRGDPVREVVYFYAPSGELLAKRDSCAPIRQEKP